MTTGRPPTPGSPPRAGSASQRHAIAPSTPSTHKQDSRTLSDGEIEGSHIDRPGAHTPRRRPQPEPRAEPIRSANVELRPDEYQLLVDGRRVALTIREFEVLLALAELEDRVIRRARIYELVWGGSMKHRERAVDVFVRKLRLKLAAVAPDWVYIHTHFAVGYRFAPERRLDGDSPAPDA